MEEVAKAAMAAAALGDKAKVSALLGDWNSGHVQHAVQQAKHLGNEKFRSAERTGPSVEKVE